MEGRSDRPGLCENSQKNTGSDPSVRGAGTDGVTRRGATLVRLGCALPAPVGLFKMRSSSFQRNQSFGSGFVEVSADAESR